MLQRSMVELVSDWNHLLFETRFYAISSEEKRAIVLTKSNWMSQTEVNYCSILIDAAKASCNPEGLVEFNRIAPRTKLTINHDVITT